MGMSPREHQVADEPVVASTHEQPEPDEAPPEQISAALATMSAAPDAAEVQAGLEKAPATPESASTVSAATEVNAHGLTADGRAVNDPRVAPAPVRDVHIETGRITLFSESEAPAVAASERNVPRASNDPRGPREDAQSADG
jgi:ribonuclease E